MTATTMTTTAATTDAGGSPASPSSFLSRLRAGTRSLRGRILVPFITVLTVTAVASVFVQRQVLLNQLDRRIDADLRQEVTELQRLVGGRAADGRCVAGRDPDGGCVVGRDPETGRPFGGDIRSVFATFLRRNIPSDFETMITFVNGERYKVPAVRSQFADIADRELRGLGTVREPELDEVVTEQGALRYLAVPVATADGQVRGVFVISQFVDLQRAQVEDVLRLVTGTELTLLVVASALAFVLAGRQLAPVRHVTETARHISDTDLSRRIDVEGTDEAADLARTFNQMLDRLQTAFQTQRNFIDDAGHELRTPITIIRGHLELLGDDPAERAETVAIVTDELDRMSRMVDDLLLLARAVRPDFLSIAQVDIGPLTEDLFTKASALADREWVLDGVGEGVIQGDGQRLTQAVMQLAQNATEHTAPGQLIALGSRRSDGEARFWVRDAGPGVSAKDAASIFDRFSRGSRTRRSDGAGLGLSIVRAIAEGHGGRVELDSTPGSGATFALVLPIEPTDDQPETGR